MYDYMRISHVEITMPVDSFQAADGLLGYPRLEIDSVKVPFATWNGVLRYIESPTAVSPGEAVYTMDMRNNGSSYEGAVCGVRFLGNDYNTVFFAFPLYFMNQDQARTAAVKVMNDFGEVGITETPMEGVAGQGLLLHQNVPNPFKEHTMISYQLDAAKHARLRIYNVAGQLVKTLVDSRQGPGSYSVAWSGTDEHNRSVSSGVYFCRLETEDQSDFRKITILR